MTVTSGIAVDATFPADADAPRVTRSLLAEAGAGFDGELAFRVGLLASEAVTNRVLDQALGGGNGRVRVEVWVDDRTVHGRVGDVAFADNRPPGSATAHTRDIEAGMMSALSDSWGTARDAAEDVSIWFDVLLGDAPTDNEYAERFAAGVEARRAL